MVSKTLRPEGSYISFFSNLVKEKGGINLAQGIPGFKPPQELLDNFKSIIDDNIHQYAPGIGNFQLLDLLQNHYSCSYEVDRKNFLVVQGATEAISLIYTYLNHKLNGRFSVLGFEPAYESYSKLPQIFGQPFINYSFDKSYSFNSSELEATITKNNVKLVFISSPGNPYGKIWSEDELLAIVKLANKHKFYIVFDAVYSEIYFHKKPALPLGFDSPNIFYVNSFSKMLCITGWRIGYLYAHEEHRKQLQEIHDYIGLCAPSLLQVAIANYLKEYNFGDSFTKQLRKDVKQSFDILYSTLKNLAFDIPTIDGGCFIWAGLPKRYDDGFDFAHSLYQATGVATIPGEHFSHNCTSWLRFNIARPNDEILKATELIVEFIGSK